MYPVRSSYKSLNLPQELSIKNMKPSTSITGNEKMTAPTELLAQFLRTIMLKDYQNALIFCKLVQQFEPSNASAKAFYPMILRKLKQKSQEPEESSDDEDDEDEDFINQTDSGIDAKDKDSSDESSSDDSEPIIHENKGLNISKTLNIIEAQREIIKRLKEKVVPHKETVETYKKEGKIKEKSRSK